MKEFIASNGGMIATTILVMVTFNAFLSGLKAALELIKDKTVTDADNKAFDFVSSVKAALQKVLDVVGYNPEHK